jgi:hypothetical protein
MVLMPVLCPYCHRDQVVKRGKTDTGKQRVVFQIWTFSGRYAMLMPASERG